MSVKLCKNTLCRRGEDFNRATIPADGMADHCSPACGAASRNKRAYNRKQAGVKIVKCEPCGGTGFVEENEPDDQDSSSD